MSIGTEDYNTITRAAASIDALLADFASGTDDVVEEVAKPIIAAHAAGPAPGGRSATALEKDSDARSDITDDFTLASVGIQLPFVSSAGDFATSDDVVEEDQAPKASPPLWHHPYTELIMQCALEQLQKKDSDHSLKSEREKSMPKRVRYSEEEKSLIKKLYAEGLGEKEIATELKVELSSERSPGSISGALHRLKEEGVMGVGQRFQKYTEAEKSLVKKLYGEGTRIKKIAAHLKEKLGSERAEKSIQALIFRLSKKGALVVNYHRKNYTEEEKRLIKKLYAEGAEYQEIADKLREEFGSNRTQAAIMIQISLLRRQGVFQAGRPASAAPIGAGAKRGKPSEDPESAKRRRQ